MRSHILLLLACWGGLLLLIDPRGDFPIYDDWAFARDVQHLVQDGGFTFSDWPAMTLMAQTLWGAAFCKVFGFSHEVLRWSVVLMGIGCSLLMYRLTELLTGDGRRALFASLLLVCNPMFLALVVTYMTEVPFMFFTLLALLCVQRWSAGKGGWYFVGACTAGLAAMFVRQHGIVLPLIFGAAYFFRGPRNIRRAVAAALPLLVALVLLVAFSQWKRSLSPTTTQYASLASLPSEMMEGINFGMAERGGLVLLLIALALLPIAAALAAAQWPRWQLRIPWWGWAGLILSACCIIATWSKFPDGLILYDVGLGAKLLKDTFWGDHLRGSLAPWALLLVRAAVCGAALYLIAAVAKGMIEPKKVITKDRTMVRIIWATGAAWAGFIVLNNLFFDRYTLALAPVALLLAVVHTKDRAIHWRVGWSALALLAIPYCLMLRDHFNWNRTRWAALDHLTHNMGVPPSMIDGGFEFNGWHKPGPHRKALREGISWWFVADDTYVVSAGRISGFIPVDTFTYQRLVPYATDTIMILERQGR